MKGTGEVIMDGPRNLNPSEDPLLLIDVDTPLSIDIDTPTELRRACTSSPPAFTPSEEWIDALEAQCTTNLYKRLKRYAVRRARNVAIAGGIVDDYYTSALVQDALGDTASGVLRWDPSMKTLEAHVRDAIATRTHHDYRRARRFRHESIDVFASDAPGTVMTEIETMLHELKEDTAVDLAARATRILTELRMLAARDREVLLLLDAFAAGATARKQVMHVAGLSNTAYHNARARLGRMVAQLSYEASSR
jgi:hypothetical protein